MTLKIREHVPTRAEAEDDKVPTPSWPSWLIPRSKPEAENRRVEYDGGARSIPHLGTGRLKTYWRRTVRDADRGGLQAVPDRVHTAAAHLGLTEPRRRAGLAIADLCVTGRESFQQLGARHIDDAIDWAAVAQAAAAARLLPGVVRARAESGDEALPAPKPEHIADVVERMKAVQAHLRALGRGRSKLPELPFIAVSGEDDHPLRPVNTYSSQHRQATMELSVWGLDLSIRYAIAGALDAGSKNVLLLHGHSSRLEEVDHLMSELEQLGYTAIALDLPCNGYSNQIDHVDVLFLERPRRAHLRLPYDEEPQSPANHSSHYTLRFLQEVVHQFVRALFAGEGLHPRIDLLAGGSLGGNLGLLFSESAPFGNPGRHAWVDPRLAWVNRVAVWSPACLWQDKGSIVCGPPHGRSLAPEVEPLRLESFEAWMNYEEPFPGVKIRQADQWYRKGWKGKGRAISEGWLSRHELYSPRLRRWHWIIAHDQLKFSHQDKVVGLDGKEVDKRHYQLLGGHLLAMCGDGDDLQFTNLYSRVMELAPKSKVPQALKDKRQSPSWEIDGAKIRGAAGHVLMWRDTGHSIHDERPRELAHVLDQFASDAL